LLKTETFHVFSGNQRTVGLTDEIVLHEPEL